MINFATVEGIVKSLPIGYYARRNVSLTCSRTAESSHYDLLKDAITISYPAIAQMVENAVNLTEESIRATVYHELSHALITPRDVKPNPIINVFEDERIESYFEGYYLDVDFKQSVRHLNGWDGKTPADPNDPFSVYYHAMRYRDTAPAVVDWIEDTLNSIHSHPNPKEVDIEYWAQETWEVITHTNYKDYLKQHTEYNVVEIESAGNEEKVLGKEHDEPSHDAGNQKKAFSFNDRLVERDDDFTKAIAILFDNFNKKTQGGSAYQTYSGAINPRNIAREDYRYFDRLAKQTGNNKFGSLHLNLFLDCSGSFAYNQRQANQILKALCEMEDKYSYFTFDVIACGIGQQLLERHDRAIDCAGGTELTRDVEPLFRKLQKPQTMNYNIVLYDGNCNPDRNVAGKANAFGVFDKANCFIISDPSNKIFIEDAVRSARVIISKNYTTQLKSNLLKALQMALS